MITNIDLHTLWMNKSEYIAALYAKYAVSSLLTAASKNVGISPTLRRRTVYNPPIQTYSLQLAIVASKWRIS